MVIATVRVQVPPCPPGFLRLCEDFRKATIFVKFPFATYLLLMAVNYIKINYTLLKILYYNLRMTTHKDIEICTLKQACEWIAYRWEPLSPVYEKAAERNPSPAELEKAKHKLVALLFDKNITARGKPCFDNPGDDLLSNVIFIREKGSYEYQRNTNALNPNGKIQIKDISEDVVMDINQNTIQSHYIVYENVEIDFAELKAVALQSYRNPEERQYTTPYIDIMLEVIEEEQIAKDNQGKAELLQGLILSKMKKAGLPESKKISEAMTTMIRMPDSQKGGIRKAKRRKN